MRESRALGLITSLAIVLGAASPARAADTPVDIHFEGGNLEQNVSRVLGRLIEARLVPFRPVPNTYGTTPAEVAEQGLHWPQGLVVDSLSASLCAINRHICQTDAEGTPLWRLDRQRSLQLPGVTKLECPGERLPRHVLCLPDVMISAYITPVRVAANPALENVGAKVLQMGGCETYNVRCQILISRLNPGYEPVSKNGVATMLLPTKAVVIRVNANKDTTEKILAVKEQVVTSLMREGALSELSNDIRLSRPINFSPKAPETLANSAEPPKLTCPPNSLATSEEALAAMGYPNKVPNPVLKNQKVVVGIWDNYGDRGHCLLQRGKTSVITKFDPADRDPLLGQPPAQRECGTQREFGPLAYDHAPFVASLIAGQPWNAKRTGANPDAQIWELEFTGNAIRSDPLDSVLGQLLVKVINISQSYADQSQDIRSNIESLLTGDDGEAKYPILFVAAAGNDGKTYDHECNVVPACWSQVNGGVSSVLSVVALARGGKAVLALSNRGRAFDVAAVGETTGAVYGNSIAHHCGSSFAAPYVSGLASLIMDRVSMIKSHPTVQDVKRRIEFTSTFSSDLDSKVRFGAIDFGRALDFAESTLVFLPGKCPTKGCSFRGHADPNPSFEIASASDQAGRQVSRRTAYMRNVRRIVSTVLSTKEQRFWIVIQEDDGSLTRLSNAKLSTGAIAFGEFGNVPLSMISDYTSCSFSQECELWRKK